MDYQVVIIESVDFLQSQERLASKAQVRDRSRFLRVLKTGQANTQAAAGLIIGLAIRQRQRLWQSYQQGSFARLLCTHYQHSFGKLSARANYRLGKSASCSPFCAVTKPAHSNRCKLLYSAPLASSITFPGLVSSLPA